MPFALDPRDAGGGQRIETAHDVVSLLIHIRLIEGDTSPLPPLGAMAVEEIAAEGVPSVRKFHEVAFQGIVSQTQMHPPLISIAGHNEVRRGIPAASEPTIAGFISQGQLQGVVLMTR